MDSDALESFPDNGGISDELVRQLDARHGDPVAAVVESLSQIRLLAVARGDYAHPSVSAEHAHRFLTQVMAMNLDLVVGDLQEGDRSRPDRLGYAVQALYHYLLRHLGYADLLQPGDRSLEDPGATPGPGGHDARAGYSLLSRGGPLAMAPATVMFVRCGSTEDWR